MSTRGVIEGYSRSTTAVPSGAGMHTPGWADGSDSVTERRRGDARARLGPSSTRRVPLEYPEVLREYSQVPLECTLSLPLKCPLTGGNVRCNEDLPIHTAAAMWRPSREIALMA
jgi:hypothetical protein